MPENFELQEEVEALQDLEAYEIPNESELSDKEPERILEGEL